MEGKFFQTKSIRLGAFPILLYFIAFCLLTFPLILKFSSHFFTDIGDGLQNIWNIWWVNKSVTELNQMPLFTTYLHFPHGTSLLAHTLNPFNGLMGIFLLKVFSLTQTFNFLVLFSFAVGGLTAFLLAFHICRSYLGSLIAGFIFTFSNYHFAHAEGHMQLVSLEWIPLFLLFWLMLIKKPRIWKGALSSLALFAVVLCDYYYFIYCVMMGIIIVLWHALRIKDLFFFVRRKYIWPLLAFIFGLLVTSAPLVLALRIFSSKNNLIGVHDSKVFSLDLLAPIIPGGHWRFEGLTRFYWTKLTGNFHESSVHMGLSVILILVLTWIYRKKIQEQSLRFWYFSMTVFLILSLGPVLHIWGKEFSWFMLPYTLLEIVFPPLKLGGVPVRMMVMVMLFASVIFAIGFKTFFENKKKRGWLAVPLFLFLCFEYLPKPLPAIKIESPAYIEALKELPGRKGVIDLVSFKTDALYYQTLHEKPVVQGYIARVSENVENQSQRIIQLVQERQFELLYRSYHIQYLVMEGEILAPSAETPIKIVFNDGKVQIYDLGAVWE